MNQITLDPGMAEWLLKVITTYLSNSSVVPGFIPSPSQKRLVAQLEAIKQKEQEQGDIDFNGL